MGPSPGKGDETSVRNAAKPAKLAGGSRETQNPESNVVDRNGNHVLPCVLGNLNTKLLGIYCNSRKHISAFKEGTPVFMHYALDELLSGRISARGTYALGPHGPGDHHGLRHTDLGLYARAQRLNTRKNLRVHLSNMTLERNKCRFWHKLPALQSLKLKKEDRNDPMDPRCERSAYAWLTGLLWFAVDDFELFTNERKYFTLISPNLARVTQCPPRRLLRRFISKALQGSIRLCNIFGSYKTACSSGDVLMRDRARNAALRQFWLERNSQRQGRESCMSNSIRVTTDTAVGESLPYWPTS